MGLDMVLCEHLKIEYKSGNATRPQSYTQEVCSWRSAYQIHHWFVQNVQGGVNDCGYYDVSFEQLQELQATCLRVKAAKGSPDVGEVINKELPPISTRLYDSSGVNNAYWITLENTLEQLNEVLSNKSEYLLNYLYTSWF